jgi:protein-disulfide isomerase
MIDQPDGFVTIRLMSQRLLVLVFFLISGIASAQAPDTVLATAKGKSFTHSVLSSDGQKALANQKSEIEAARSNLLSQMVAEELLKLEAKTLSSTPEKLIGSARAKVPEPPAAQIQALYNANRQALGNRELVEVRKDIIAYLKRDAEQKAVSDYIGSLQTKYKFAAGKGVNAADLKPTDVLVTFGQRSVTAQEFEAANRFKINDALWQAYEDLRAELEIGVLNELIVEEARARNVQPNEVIAAEVTDKMRSFAPGERAELETALMNRLFSKYEVKILLKEPPVLAQDVTVDDDPVQGPAAAPVTIVMFSDFQCPACARTHPVLKSVVAEFGEKVRLVVRDFPLENIHENAFAAAKAANAAGAQGKYFEYIDLLYRNQSALDATSLKKYAGDVGLNVKQFDVDSTLERSAAEIRKDAADGEKYGVSGTPTIFVNGVKVHRLSADSFRRAINRALAK